MESFLGGPFILNQLPNAFYDDEIDKTVMPFKNYTIFKPSHSPPLFTPPSTRCPIFFPPLVPPPIQQLEEEDKDNNNDDDDNVVDNKDQELLINDTDNDQEIVIIPVQDNQEQPMNNINNQGSLMSNSNNQMSLMNNVNNQLPTNNINNQGMPMNNINNQRLLMNNPNNQGISTNIPIQNSQVQPMTSYIGSYQGPYTNNIGQGPPTVHYASNYQEPQTMTNQNNQLFSANSMFNQRQQMPSYVGSYQGFSTMTPNQNNQGGSMHPHVRSYQGPQMVTTRNAFTSSYGNNFNYNQNFFAQQNVSQSTFYGQPPPQPPPPQTSTFYGQTY